MLTRLITPVTPNHISQTYYTIDYLQKRSLVIDIIILDESQDITPVFYELAHKIIHDNNKLSTQLCLLGDRYQCIYEYNGSDTRFLSYADKLFTGNNNNWKNNNLNESFRITNEMASFLNKCVLKFDRIVANKSGSKVRYLICDAFGFDDKVVYLEVKNKINKHGYDNMFIIAPSVRSERSPVRNLANKLSKDGINIYIPNSDEDKLDDQIMNGKLVFSSFHQAKGLERKVIIVFGFDDSYFRYFKKDVDQLVCPNEVYVALTRASEHLTIVHHKHNNFLPFLDLQKLANHCEIIGNKRINLNTVDDDKDVNTSVTDLIKHLNSDVINEALSYVQISKVKDCEKLMLCVERLKCIISSNALFEKNFEIMHLEELHNRKLVGSIDCIDDCNVYEFKCVLELTNEHYLQLAIYAYMHSISNLHQEHKQYNYILFNILTSETYQITASIDNLRKMIEFIIISKYSSRKVLCDDTFFKSMNAISSKFVKTSNELETINDDTINNKTYMF